MIRTRSWKSIQGTPPIHVSATGAEEITHEAFWAFCQSKVNEILASRSGALIDIAILAEKDPKRPGWYVWAVPRKDARELLEEENWQIPAEEKDKMRGVFEATDRVPILLRSTGKRGFLGVDVSETIFTFDTPCWNDKGGQA